MIYNSIVNTKVLITFLVIIAVGLGAYSLGRNQLNLPQLVQSPDPTANWQTYSDTKYNYSIKFPQELFRLCPQIQGDRAFYLYDKNYGCEGEEPVAIGIRNDLEGTGDITESSYKNCYYVQETKIDFAGINSTKYENIILNDEGSCMFASDYARYSKHIIVKRDGRLYNIFYHDYENKELKNQILSTFKFTD